MKNCDTPETVSDSALGKSRAPPGYANLKDSQIPPRHAAATSLWNNTVTMNDSSSQMRIYIQFLSDASPFSIICLFMPRRSLGKSIPSVPQVIDVLENGTERKYIFILCHGSYAVIDHSGRQKEILAPFLTAARMIPLRIDIWHNLERIFLAGVSGNEGEVEVDRYALYSPLVMLLSNFS